MTKTEKIKKAIAEQRAMLSASSKLDKAITDRKAEKTKRPVQTVQTKRPVQTEKTAENVKKSTYDIAVEKMTRMQTATKKDNDINRLSRYISDYLNDNGYTEKTKNHIATVLTPLAIRIVKNKLYAIQYRKDRTYSIYNDPIMIELFRNYRFEKIDPLTLHFSELETVDRQSYSFNSNSLKTAEQCTKAAEYTSTTIAADIVNACVLSLLESIENMYNNGKFVDLLSCYIIPYNTVDKNGIPIDPKKWRYKAVNAVNIAGDVIERVFADYERNKHKSLDDFNTLYDRNGYEKMPAISAISDSYGDIEITEEMTELLKNWIDKLELSETVKAIAADKYINGLTVEQIAAKIKKCNNTVEKHLINFRNTLKEYINGENPDKIKSACKKKYVVAYNAYNKEVAKYDSINAAARALNVHKSAVQKALRSPRVATCKGYTFDIIYI